MILRELETGALRALVACCHTALDGCGLALWLFRKRGVQVLIPAAPAQRRRVLRLGFAGALLHNGGRFRARRLLATATAVRGDLRVQRAPGLLPAGAYLALGSAPLARKVRCTGAPLILPARGVLARAGALDLDLPRVLAFFVRRAPVGALAGDAAVMILVTDCDPKRGRGADRGEQQHVAQHGQRCATC